MVEFLLARFRQAKVVAKPLQQVGRPLRGGGIRECGVAELRLLLLTYASPGSGIPPGASGTAT